MNQHTCTHTYFLMNRLTRNPFRPETRSDPNSFRPEPILTRTKTTRFLIDPF
ncbi:hypothetical protein HanXRQr2_Chr14g0637971 [Helianthus annuus]|uniref:Uncharacterized protein n=1 Tax=Helianthus annuus TaxID=4232 RepID=A0A9K3E9P4_HELAN|nr:hypothetical protein HanXRQr2_Chr14g0637971 [Helianthus annuus]KAJ0839870.1 hypothetical protein HanPSC8_Chr14g0611911 [Helianthus annuus]